MTRFLEATRERFLVAIAASLPAERFIELHFFSPIRQGGIESGVAVIAAHPERVEEIAVADAAPPPGHSEERSDPSCHSDERSDPSCHSEERSDPSCHSEERSDPSCHSEERSDEESALLLHEDVQIPRRFAPRDDSQGFAPRDDSQGVVPRDDSQGVVPRDDSGRPTVYSAKYKLVLKGPDRGKWECRVVAEADAPLVTVETVVRGVQRRSGDAEEPERMSGDDARDYLITATR